MSRSPRQRHVFPETPLPLREGPGEGETFALSFDAHNTSHANQLTRRAFFGTAAVASLAAAGGGQLAFDDLLHPAKKPLGESLVPASPDRDAVALALNRLGYGPWPGDYARVKAMGVDAYIEEQLQPDAIDDSACDWRVRRLESLNAPVGELFEFKQDFLLQELTQATVLRAVYSKRQLQEVMVNFWTDHFNVATSKGDCPWLKAADDREVIRKHALGSFPAMVKASALSPAMLWYLDGRANRKANEADQPNENYARELMELHTLGVRGGYTQADVMEVARCFTGWYVRSEEVFRKSRVEFHAEWHDDGAKHVLGENIPAGLGAVDLDRVVAVVCAHPATARHIATKLCARFVGNAQEEMVRPVAESFRTSGGDIKTTLRTLFSQPQFLASHQAGFKRPFEFVVSAMRATGAETDGGAGVSDYLLRMGHAPFQYPTPDGYPMEPEPWYGGMLWRWHFAAALAESRIEGTTVDWPALRGWAGDDRAIATHIMGRQLSNDEWAACDRSGKGAPFVLASPAFQWC